MSSVRSGAASMASAVVRSTSETLSTIKPARWRSRPNHDKPTPVALFEPGHIETAPLIDHRNDDAAKIDDSLEEPGRLGDPRDPVRRARHFVNRFHRQPELTVAEAEHQKLPLLAPFGRSAVYGSAGFGVVA